MTNECWVPARAVSMLITFKRQCLANNDLSLKAAGCGGLTVAHLIDELIENVNAMESRYHETQMRLSTEREANKHFDEMLRGYTPEILTDEEKAELNALVDKWVARDAEEEDEDA